MSVPVRFRLLIGNSISQPDYEPQPDYGPMPENVEDERLRFLKEEQERKNDKQFIKWLVLGVIVVSIIVYWITR